jgi:hypothetical protein
LLPFFIFVFFFCLGCPEGTPSEKKKDEKRGITKGGLLRKQKIGENLPSKKNKEQLIKNN